jgi:hypothetical protein
MPKSLLKNIWIFLFFTACATSSKNASERNNHHIADGQPPISQSTNGSVLPSINPDSILTGIKPLSLLDLPQSQDGEIILSDGFYEADFKSYCLQPGTPTPSNMDAYLQAPLGGYRKDIVESVLRNSLVRPDLEQKNIQLLLWSVVSGSDYNKLSSSVKMTARQLLSSRQLFALQGGVMGVMKSIATAFPETGINGSYNDMRRLFELGTSSYEAYERIAVLRQPSIISRADYKKDQWYQQEGGYYVRYFPSGYQRIKIQVFVPEGIQKNEANIPEDYLLFDPVTLMAIPANSNAQRLGIGAPVAEVIRKVIEIQKVPRTPKKPPTNNPNPKGIVMK